MIYKRTFLAGICITKDRYWNLNMDYRSAIVRVVRKTYPRILVFKNYDQNILLLGVPDRSQRAFILSLEDWIRQNLHMSLKVICVNTVDSSWEELEDRGDIENV